MNKALWALPVSAILLSGCAVRDYIRTLPCCEQPRPAAVAHCDIKFAYNKADVRSSDMHKINAWAKRLVADPGMTVRIEGHADVRGSEEYNVNLGMRRSESVKSALMAKGVKADQMELASYGADQPVAHGTGEEVWAQNRCVNITD